MNEPLPPRNFWERYTNFIVRSMVVFFLVCLVGLLLPSTGGHGVASRRMAATNNLKQIGLAFHNYQDTYGRLPPAYVTDGQGEPLYSWRVLLLPFLEETQLYEEFHLDESWESEHNRQLLERMPTVYRTPMWPYARGEIDGKTPYLGIVDTRDGRTILRPGEGRSLWESFRNESYDPVPDGIANTAIVIGDPTRMVEWTKPEDIDPLELLALTPLADNEWHAMLILRGDASTEAIGEENRDELVGLVYCDDGRLPEEE